MQGNIFNNQENDHPSFYSGLFNFGERPRSPFSFKPASTINVFGDFYGGGDSSLASLNLFSSSLGKNDDDMNNNLSEDDDDYQHSMEMMRYLSDSVPIFSSKNKEKNEEEDENENQNESNEENDNKKRSNEEEEENENRNQNPNQNQMIKENRIIKEDEENNKKISIEIEKEKESLTTYGDVDNFFESENPRAQENNENMNSNNENNDSQFRPFFVTFKERIEQEKNIKCEHPGCNKYYKTFQLKLFDHDKESKECKEDIITLLNMINKAKKIIKKIIKRNENKIKNKKKRINEKLITNKFLRSMLYNFPHKNYASLILGINLDE